MTTSKGNPAVMCCVPSIVCCNEAAHTLVQQACLENDESGEFVPRLMPSWKPYGGHYEKIKSDMGCDTMRAPLWFESMSCLPP